MQLFRQGAEEFHASQVVGDVVLRTPPSIALLSVILAGVTALGAAVVTLVQFPRVEIVEGRLIPVAGLVEVVASRSGIVMDVNHADGDLISRNEVVATIRVSGDTLSGNVGATLNQELASEISAGSDLAAIEVSRLEDAAEEARRSKLSLTEDMDRLTAQITLQRDRLALVQGQLQRAESLAARGFYPQRQLDDQRSAMLTAQQTMLSYERELLGLRRSLSEVDHLIADTAGEIAESRARARQARSQFQQRSATLELEDRYTIRATQPGRLAGATVSEGQWIEAGAAVATLLPEQGKLELEILVPSRARAFVVAGQPVTILLDAFPHRRYGTLEGVVLSVADVATTPSSEGTASGYRARISLDRQSMEVGDRRVQLRPGMLAEARIVLERMSLVERIMAPTDGRAGHGR